MNSYQNNQQSNNKLHYKYPGLGLYDFSAQKSERKLLDKGTCTSNKDQATSTEQPWPAKRARLLCCSPNKELFTGFRNPSSLQDYTKSSTGGLAPFYSALSTKPTTIFGKPKFQKHSRVTVKTPTKSFSTFPSFTKPKSQLNITPKFKSVSNFRYSAPISLPQEMSLNLTSEPLDLARLKRKTEPEKEVKIQQSKRKEWDGITNEPKTYIDDLLNYRLQNFIGTDFVIRIDGLIYPCHKFVLEAHCRFFCDKLYLQEYDLPASHVSPQAFELIYDWMINSDRLCPNIDMSNVYQVLSASLFLGIEDLIVQCNRIIRENKTACK